MKVNRKESVTSGVYISTTTCIKKSFKLQIKERNIILNISYIH